MSDIRFNYYIIIKIIGIITLISGLFMLPALLCAFYYHEENMIEGLGLSAGITILFGGSIFFALKPLRVHLRMREGYLVVTLAWIIASLFGSLPYFFSGITSDFATGFLNLYPALPLPAVLLLLPPCQNPCFCGNHSPNG